MALLREEIMRLFGSCVSCLLILGCGSKPSVDIRARLATDAVTVDADDPSVWVNPADPARSLIIGTNKVPAPQGALVVFGLDGKTRQTVAGLDRPNNVDVEYGLSLGGRPVDIAVTTERLKHQLRIYRIAPDGLTEVTANNGIPVFEGQDGDEGAPMGISLYRRPHDGAVFAIVGRKTGPAQGYLWHYRLIDDGAGHVKGVKVREFGSYSGKKEIEAIAVDDELGYIYYADELFGIHKWKADPDDPEAGRELAVFGQSGFTQDHEGIAIYATGRGAGYIVCTDQIENNTVYRIFRREGAAGSPHQHELVKAVRSDADSTDGIEVTSAALGSDFPKGLLVVMNSKGKNFLIYDWRDIGLQ